MKFHDFPRRRRRRQTGRIVRRRGRGRSGQRAVGALTAVAAILAPLLWFIPAAAAEDGTYTLAIKKVWQNAVADDTATITVTVNGEVKETGKSTAPSGNSGPVDVLTVQVTGNDLVELSETFTTSDAAYTYHGDFRCDPNIPSPWEFNMPAEAVTCTVYNDRTAPIAPTVNKYVEIARPDGRGEYTVLSTDADGVTVRPGDKLTYRLEVHVIDPYTGQVSVDNLSGIAGVDFSTSTMTVDGDSHLTATMESAPLAVVLEADGLPENVDVTVTFSGIVVADPVGEDGSPVTEIVNDIEEGTPGNFTCEGLRCSTRNPVELIVPPPPPPVLPTPEPAVLVISKSADPLTVAAGEPFTYTLAVRNTSSETATALTIADPIPANVAVTPPPEPDPWGCAVTGADADGFGGELRCDWVGPLPGGDAAAPVVVDAVLAVATSSATVNTATLTWTNPPGATPVTDTAQDSAIVGIRAVVEESTAGTPQTTRVATPSATPSTVTVVPDIDVLAETGPPLRQIAWTVVALLLAGAALITIAAIRRRSRVR